MRKGFVAAADLDEKGQRFNVSEAPAISKHVVDVGVARPAITGPDF